MLVGFYFSMLLLVMSFCFVGILYKHVRLYQFHQISLLCDHHELACTLKDPSRRVDMKQTSPISFRKKIDWVIGKQSFENLLSWDILKPNMCSYSLIYFGSLLIASWSLLIAIWLLLSSISYNFSNKWYHRRVPAEYT